MAGNPNTSNIMVSESLIYTMVCKEVLYCFCKVIYILSDANFVMRMITTVPNLTSCTLVAFIILIPKLFTFFHRC